MKRWILPFGFLLIALGAAFYYQQLQASARAGYPAPDFALKDLHGRTHRLSDFRGKIVFLNVWATWCPPCRMEMPSMENLYRRFQGHDFVMLAVSEDEAGLEAARAFVDEVGISFPVLLDEDGWIPPRYGVTGYPETFIIDREGRVIHHAIGPEDWDSEPAIAFFTRLVAHSPTAVSGDQARAAG